MQDLSDVALVIRELQFLANHNYRSPQERTRRVWSAHNQAFLELQATYSRILEQNSADIAKALKTRSFRASLWIANGEGQLARWATEGIHYTSIRELKFVPTGHDSPWVAGESIGSEEVKLQDVARDKRIRPHWRSVLAIPIFTRDGHSPDFAAGVLTFALRNQAASLLERQDDWTSLIQQLSSDWGTRLSALSFRN